MEYHNNILTVSGSEIIGSVCTKANYDKLVQRGKLRVIRRASYCTPALIEWNSVPEKVKERFVEVHGDPTEQVQGYSIRNFIRVDYDGNDFFAKYLLSDGRNLPTAKQIEYSTNASVLNAISRVINDRTAKRKALGGSTRNIWPNLAETVSKLKDDVKHTLPDNPVRLRQRLLAYRKDGYVSLISGKFLNNNAAKVVDIEQEATIRGLLRKHNNLDNEQIRMLYSIIAEKMGWKPVTAATIGNYREKWDLDTYSGRKGESSFDNFKAMQVTRRAPALPLMYWTVDGWDAELLYQKTDTDKNGNTRTTYHNRLTVVIVLDPCNKYPVGYAIGSNESPELIRAALRDAVNHTARLFGQRHKVLQLQTDNYAKKTLQPVYEAISDYFTPARVHNAKSKVIEPYFRHINKKYCQLMPNWSGFGIASGSKSQPSSEWLNKIRHSFPDEAGCRLQIERIIEMERADKLARYLEAYNQVPEEDKRLMSDQDFLFMLGESTGYTNRLQGSGVVVTINGVKRQYDCFDMKFRQLSYMDWTVKYDPAAPESVLATSSDGSLRFTLTEKYVQPMALKERKPGDADQLKRISDHNKSIKGHITQQIADDHDTVTQMFSRHPELEGTLTKLLLVDSMGQHKDNKSAARLNPARKMLGKQKQTVEIEQQQSWDQEQEEYLKSKVNLSEYTNNL